MKRLNGVVSKMLATITKRPIKKEASSKKQSFDVKKEVRYLTRKWVITCLRDGNPGRWAASAGTLSSPRASRFRRVNGGLHVARALTGILSPVDS